MDLASFQRRHGLCFRNESLLRQAMTHRSWPHEQGGPAGLEGNYERLEFLGDAVLAFAVTRMLYDRFPDMPEGDLTRLRSALVRSETLADIATELELGAFLRLGRGEEQNGGRQRRSILGDAFEALLGAIFIDRGQGAAEDFVRAWLGPLIDGLQAADLLDPRSRLQEICQAALLATPV
ncbi:MAG: ribonuclease III, partial [Anaerolineaceae bacterium]|nr:ribonuclease III [Anaerolineaceae bacterium]